MSDRPESLGVWLNDDFVGTIYDATPLAFEYSEAWLSSSGRNPIGRIPKQPGRQEGPYVAAFFDNLLPEGDLRARLGQKYHASTVFSLLLALGGDSIGAFVLLPGKQTPEPAAYVRTSWDRIARDLAKTGMSAADIQTKDARISLSGAQDKTTLVVDVNGDPWLPRGYSPSTHILKPDIQRVRGVYASAVNESIVMRAALYADMEVASVAYEHHTKSCLIRRFDRVGVYPESIRRLVQYDMCQLAGVASSGKYEAEGGPSLRRCAEIIREESTQPAVDLRRLIDWVFFNLYAGNNDSHAKNLSLYTSPGQGTRLTPFYDLVATRVYPSLSARFAFAIGGEYVSGNISRSHIEAMARELGMGTNYVLDRAEATAMLVPPACERAIEEFESKQGRKLTEQQRQLVSNLRKFVASNVKRLHKSFSGSAPAAKLAAEPANESSTRRRMSKP
jgi:serine/threonine-protein kinase HipA